VELARLKDLSRETRKHPTFNMSTSDVSQPLFIQKYQPLRFVDFEMNSELRAVLEILIGINHLNILLIGDVGSGKTSLLNAIIREYYALPSDADFSENILHINNLKEQGINFYRNDVKTFCQTCSSIKGKKKFVVLDDIDLINEQSQQVFRNCIDKYSHNVHFISACTNNQKVIESLQSRLLIVKIKPLQHENLMKIVRKIQHAEKLEIDDEAVEFILSISNNTVKTVVNYMEKFHLLQMPVTMDLAMQTCTNISFRTFEEYTSCLRERRLYEAVMTLLAIYDRGYSVMDILDNYFLFVKATNVLTEVEKYEIVPLICKYITVFHNIHEIEVELALFSNNLCDVLQKK